MTPEEMQKAYENRDRLEEAESRAKARAGFFAKDEVGCLSGRAFMYLMGEQPPLGFTNLPVACGRKDTNRFVGWTDVEQLLVHGEPMMFEVTCPDCWKLWFLASGARRGDTKAREALEKLRPKSARR